MLISTSWFRPRCSWLLTSASGVEMFTLPQLIPAPLISPEWGKPISIPRVHISRNAVFLRRSSSRGTLAFKMKVSYRNNAVELAIDDPFAIGNAVEDNGRAETERALIRPRLANFEATLNRSSKWLVSALFGFILLWKHDAEALWALMGSLVNAWLSTILKIILNQNRPSALRSDPGMPSSHAQSIFYLAILAVVSVTQEMGTNMYTVVGGVIALLCGSYLSWLRISQGFHTVGQVLVGATLGSTCSLIWVWMWHSFVHQSFISSIRVRIVIFLCFSFFCAAFLFHVAQNWLQDE